MNVSEAIDSLIIIDRNVDLVTPLLTQLTYEGLIDEFFGIQNCVLYSLSHGHSLRVTDKNRFLKIHAAAHVKVDSALLVAQQPGTAPSPSQTSSLPTTPAQTKKKYHLKSSSDPLFAQLRDMNFAIIGGKLNKEARRLDAEYKVTDFGCIASP